MTASSDGLKRFATAGCPPRSHPQTRWWRRRGAGASWQLGTRDRLFRVQASDVPVGCTRRNPHGTDASQPHNTRLPLHHLFPILMRGPDVLRQRAPCVPLAHTCGSGTQQHKTTHFMAHAEGCMGKLMLLAVFAATGNAEGVVPL